MDILVTGGAGFIGSHLAEKLLEKGHRVRVLDNLVTGLYQNINHLQDQERFSLTVDDVMSPEVVQTCAEGVDKIFHLAATVGVKNIIDHPLESIETNVRGTENVLQVANRTKTPVFVASTSEVYGKNGNLPFSEDDDRVLGSIETTRWSYSCTKALDEFLAFAYWKTKHLPIVIGRLFNTVGPRQIGRYGMVVPRFVKQAMLNRPLTVHGDGQQTRCFMDVDDTTDAILALMSTPEAHGRVFNIGSTERVSIEQLAHRVIAKTRSSSRIVYVPYEQAYEEGFEDMRHRVPDTTRLRELTDFTPRHDLDSILGRIHGYLQSNGEVA